MADTPDHDPQETREWLDALEGVLAARVSRRGFMQSLGVSAAAASVANTAEALAKGHAAGGNSQTAELPGQAAFSDLLDRFKKRG